MELTVAAKIESEGLHETEQALLECLVKEGKLRQLLETTKASLANTEREKQALLQKLPRARTT